MKPFTWLLAALAALACVLFFGGLSCARVPATVPPMPTVATQKPAARKKVSAVKKPAPSPFPGLVRDSLTGLYVKPLAPGQKPISRKALEAALTEAVPN